MKYLIAASGNDLNAKVARRFGHTEYFLLVDSETKEYKVFPGVGHDEPAHGIARFIDQDIQRVIVGNIGPGAFQDIRDKGWTIYLCRNMTVLEALESVESGKVSPLDKPTMKHSIHAAREVHGGEHGHIHGPHHDHAHGPGHGMGRGRHQRSE